MKVSDLVAAYIKARDKEAKLKAEYEAAVEPIKELREKIEARGRLHAVLTRDDDIFLPLAERVALAHRANAALFLSIHADTLAAPHVEGATVYTVSAAASDAEAARTAEHENSADQAAGLESPAAALRSFNRSSIGQTRCGSPSNHSRRPAAPTRWL